MIDVLPTTEFPKSDLDEPSSNQTGKVLGEGD
jgi:hypothetical protein